MSDDHTDQELQAVVAKAYAAIAEPESFVPLLNQMIEADEKLGGIGAAADMHFQNAESILDKVYPLKEADYTALHTHLEARIDCDLALDENMRVISLNDKVFEGDWIGQGGFAPENLFDPARATLDQQRLREAKQGDERLFIRLFTRTDDDSGRWFCAFRAPIGGAHVIALQAVRLRWDDRSGAAFEQAMELTPTEGALTRHLVTGGKLRDFAEGRGTALGTVRNQLKALQRKLAINSKEDLLLLYAGFIHSLAPTAETAESIEHVCPNMFVDPAGGTIAWEEYGDPRGRPVLFFHALEGPLFTARVNEAARDFGLRLIGPWRPNYGGTTGGKPGASSPMEFAERLPALLDHLNLDRVVALGTQAGTPFMAAFVKSYPERLAGAVAAGPFFPIAQSSDYEFLQKRQRTHFRISRLTPAFARVYMRAMLASMGTGEFYKFVQDYYDSCPRELETVQQPEMILNFRKAANYVLPKGSDGPVDTMLNWSAEWSHLLRDMPIPLKVMIGGADSNASPEFSRLSCERYGLSEPVILPGAGSFLIADKPRDVMEALRREFDD